MKREHAASSTGGSSASLAHLASSQDFAGQLLRESEDRFRIMADCAPVLLWMAGRDARCNFFNQAWLTFTGRVMEQEIGYGWVEGVHPEDFQICVDTYMQAFNSRTSFSMDYRLLRADGTYRWVLDSGVPRILSDGTFVGYIGSCVDITERKLAEDVLRRSYAEQIRLNQIKDEFLATVSHELRTPLNIILGHATLLAGGSQSGTEVKETASVIQRHARLQTRLINDLLDISAVVTGKLRIKPQEVSLVTLVKDCVESFQFAAASRGIALSASFSDPEILISGDPQRLQQVAWNLVSNAIKFSSERGRIEVVVVREGGTVRVSVKDSGKGIDAHFLPHVFERFRQEDASVRRKFGGIGLGLSIAKELVELHGGSISIASEGPGRGTMATVSLPMTFSSRLGDVEDQWTGAHHDA